MNTFYYLSSCDTCKRILKTLKLGDDIQLVDLKTQPLTKVVLEDIFQHTDSYEALLNRRAQKLKEIDKSSLTEEKIKMLLLSHYTFIKRPILHYNNQWFIGNAKATVQAAKEALDG